MYIYKTFKRPPTIVGKVLDGMAKIKAPWRSKALDYDVKKAHSDYQSIELRLAWFNKRNAFVNICHWRNEKKIVFLFWGPMHKH